MHTARRKLLTHRARESFAALLLLPVFAAVPVFSQPASTAAGLTVKCEARSIQPGEVVLMSVNCSRPVESLSARVFHKNIPFFGDDSGTVWMGLLGIDLDSKPGLYTVHFKARRGASRIGTDYPLRVRFKKFPVRRLKVPPRFVTPPQKDLARIRRESRHLTSIIRTVDPAKLWRGLFTAPVSGEPTSSFGKRSVFNGHPRSPHSGTDFHARRGTPVKAPNAGRVVLAANLYFSGNTVVLDHGLGLYSFLAHLSKMSVTEGQRVEKGQIVGKVGATGRVTGPHLHWSVRLNGARVDPLSLMQVLHSFTSENPEEETLLNEVGKTGKGR